MNHEIKFCEVPFFKLKFEHHLTVKPILLDKIEKSTSLKLNKDEHCISDFYKKENNIITFNNFQTDTRDYANYITPFLRICLENVFKQYNINQIEIKELWFQQYYKMNYHNWHDHILYHWVAIYYVELDDSSPKTMFKNFLGETFQPDIKEGDIVIFPGFLKHKSPTNKTNSRKTVVTCNIEEIYND